MISTYPQNMIESFRQIPTATLTTILLKQGIRNVWIRGALPLSGTQKRVAGPAFTLRFIPARGDLATPASWAAPVSTRTAIESMPQGSVVVVAANGCTEAGIFGDILCQRMQIIGVEAMITDGVVRDVAGVSQTGLAVWSAGTAAPPSIAGLTFVNWQEPVGCGGVAIYPNDIMVADDDGAVVVPARLVNSVLKAAIQQEKLEDWIMQKVKDGEKLPGLYPPNDENRQRFENGE